MTALRKRMIEDMQLRNLSPQTQQRTYRHHIAGLAQFYQTSLEHLNLEDLRQFQVYLASDCRYSAESGNRALLRERPSLLNRAALIVAYSAGLRVSEVGRHASANPGVGRHLSTTPGRLPADACLALASALA